MNIQKRILHSSQLPRSLSTSNISRKYINGFQLIKERIPVDILKEKPEIEKITHSIVKPYFSIIKKGKKPEITKWNSSINEYYEKMFEGINNFKENFYDYNKEEESKLKGYDLIKKENNSFSKMYKKIQKDKNKYNTGTYLDHKILLGIANRYIARGMKIPDITVEHNVFKGNPLILGGSELEDFFIYKLGEKHKAMKFMRKVNAIVNKKKLGDSSENTRERDNEDQIESDRPKGYIPPEVLIPNLKSDIEKTKFTLSNIINFDKFFNNIKKKKYVILKKNINNINRNKIRGILSGHQKIYSNSSLSTGVYGTHGSRVVSSKYSSLGTKEYSANSHVSSAVSRDKSIKLKYSPLPSPLSRKYIPIKRNNFQKQNSDPNEIFTSEQTKINDLSKDINYKRGINFEKFFDEKNKDLNNENKIENEKSLINKEFEANLNKNNSNIINKDNSLSLMNNLNPIDKTEKKEENSSSRHKEIESLFISLSNRKLRKNINNNKIKNFFEKQGYNNLDKKFTNKDTYNYIKKIKNNTADKNYIKDKVKLQSGKYSLQLLSKKEKEVLDKNEKFVDTILKSERKILKILCESKVEE